MAMWTLIQEVLADDVRVSAILLLASWDQARDPTELESRLLALEQLGVAAELLLLPPHARSNHARAFRKLESVRIDLEDVYPHTRIATELEQRLTALAPDAILGFDTGTLLALRGYGQAPILAIPGDPLHLVWKYRLRLTPIHERVRPRYAKDVLRLAVSGSTWRGSFLDLVGEAASAAVFGTQHADWLRQNGIPCIDFPVPVVDRGTGAPTRPLHDPPRILLLGGLASTATRLGLRLVPKLLDELDRRLGAGAFEVVIAGGGTLPGRLARALQRSNVRFLGYIEDSAAAMRDADVFLVPSPYPVGARTRIVEAFSAGCAIVTHRLAGLGLPEIMDDRNALVGDSVEHLARQVVRVLRDDGLRRSLRVEARRTYAHHFAPAVACAPVVGRLRQLAERTSLQRRAS
jgi:glycosyltransferase involved in cell wall biosynthesis